MLIIGHRGAGGIAPENTMASFRAGLESGADMLEFDVRLTKDRVPVVIHDSRLIRTHRLRESIAGVTLKELAALTPDQPIPTLEKVLDTYFGVILLNIELKSRGSGQVVVSLLQDRYIRKSKDWDNIIISSFKGSELVAIRRRSSKVNIALLHDQNPFLFIAYHRYIQFTAVGFHRLYLNRFALEIARKSGLFIYAYTVDRPAALPLLERQNIDGIVTNYPDKFRRALET
jgi:glycerophosphoryl diester phosphodiesterase